MEIEDLIAGKFLTDEVIPKTKHYLLKYFSKGATRAFLRYSFYSLEWKQFINHTGWFMTERYHSQLVKKLKDLVNKHDQAKQDFDLELVYKIEKEKFKYHGKDNKK